MIKVKYTSVDNWRGKWKTFKTLKGARKYAQHWIGKHPELGTTYAISGDGIGKIEAEGVPLKELFGDEKPAEQSEEDALEEYHRKLEEDHRAMIIAAAESFRDAYEVKRRPGCNCSDQQLIHVGCDCRDPW